MPDTAPKNHATTIVMLRSSQQHHVQLSAMADQKANALMAACFVTLSISVAYSSAHAASLALMVIMGFAILTAVFAALAVMPRISNHKVVGGTKNPLFFGDFADLSFEQYLQEMEPLLHNDERVNEALIRDIYCIGQVLKHRKYRLLSLAYRCFILGLVLAPLAWVLESGVLG